MSRWRERATFVSLRAETLATRLAIAAATAGATRHAPPPATGAMRVLMLASQPASHAGTRYRLGLWADRLRRRGHEVELSLPVTGARGEELYVRKDYAARAEQHRRTLASRRAAVARAGEFHVVIAHLDTLRYWEYDPPFVGEAVARTAGRFVLDLDDLPVVRGENRPGPRALRLAALADGLVLGNRELRSYYPDRPAWHVPTCIEPSQWPVRPARTGEQPVLLGWVGTPTGLVGLERLAPVLAAACARYGAKLRVVCDVKPDLPGVPLDFVSWSGAREVEDIVPFDVGLAPLDDGPRARCKCGLKALQSMAAGAPVIASPVGALREIVVDGKTGLHATTPEQWAAALDALLRDPALRMRMGRAGREAVERRWSFDVHEAAFESALRGVGGRPDASSSSSLKCDDSRRHR
jgi:glycosyltransferase involved in cell wall biosynthesis